VNADTKYANTVARDSRDGAKEQVGQNDGYHNNVQRESLKSTNLGIKRTAFKAAKA
jgi:hypothetical protein